jgi:hypothetical protein
MPPTDEMWLKIAFWCGMNPGMISEEIVALLRERYPKMTENEAWVTVARYRNERHTLQENA